MSEPTIKLELTIDEVNLILESLGDQPFKSVFALVARLQAQARSQLEDGANPVPTSTPQSPSPDMGDEAPQMP